MTANSRRGRPRLPVMREAWEIQRLRYRRYSLRRMHLWSMSIFVCLCYAGHTNGQQNHYGFCFSKLKEADSDGDNMLSATEYNVFVSFFSNGAVTTPISDDVLQPFKAMAAGSSNIAIDGISADLGSQTASLMMELCQSVKSSLMTHFGVSMTFDSCIGALENCDSVAPSGYLAPDTELVHFMGDIAGDSLGDITNYDDLPNLVKHAFLDMAINGMIAGPEGAAYLQEFCDRALLASVMEATIVARVDKTISPSLSPAVKETRIADNGKKTVVQTSKPPNAEFELTDEIFASCLKDIMLSDINRNDLLERREFGRLTDRLYNKAFGSDIDQKTEAIIDKAYEDILLDQNKRVAASVAGSKPGKSPSRREKKMLQYVCRTAHEAIRNAHAAESSKVDDGEESSSKDVANVDSDEFFETCKISLFVSDKDKDSYLDQEEFTALIARLARTDDVDFRSMDDSFKRCFREAGKGGNIDISGTSPVAVTSILQHARLQSVCGKIERAISTYNGENDVGSSASIGDGDLLARNSDLKNEFPGLSEEFFRMCTMAMYIADDNRDEALSRSEFVTFVGRLTFDKIGNEAYENLDELFHIIYEELADTSGLVGVYGSRPGYRRNYDEEKTLRYICQSLNGAMVDLESSPATEGTGTFQFIEENSTGDEEQEEESIGSEDKQDQSDLADDGMESIGDLTSDVPDIDIKQENSRKPNPAPEDTRLFNFNNKTFTSRAEMSFTKFDRCQAKIGKADDDADSFLNKDEYVILLKYLGGKDIQVSSFDALPIVLQTPFLKMSIDQPAIGIYGTHIGEKPTNLNIERLQMFCSDVFDAFFIQPMEELVDLDCLSSMRIADHNLDRILDHKEFVRFLNVWTNGRFEGLSFSALPFEVRAQFNWSSNFDHIFSIQGSALIDEFERDVHLRDEFCRRIKSTFLSLTPPLTMTEHCQLSLTVSDSNQDGLLSKQEYISLVSVFTDKLWEPSQRFKNMDEELQDIYEARIGESGSMELEVDMTNFCTDFDLAITIAQHKKVVQNQCRTSLISGDTDANGRLSREEFAAVLMELSFRGSLVGKQHSYSLDDLSDAVQRYFGTITRGDNDLDLTTFKFINATNQAEVSSICNELLGSLLKDLTSSFVPVYNSFLIATANTTQNAKADSDYEQVVLERAYARFASGLFDRRRRLFEVVGVMPSSTSVDLIDVVDCPPSLDDEFSQCAVVFAHFNATVFGKVNEEALSSDLSNDYQSMIDSGEMERQILSVDPQFTTRVLRASFPVKPGEYSDTTMQESYILESGTVMMMIFSIIVAIFFIGIGLYYGRRLALRQKAVFENSQSTGDTYVDFSDSENDRGLSESERRAKEDYMALQEYILPLLIAQAYHLPGYSYGEDLFQYIYNRHPILGLCWRHPLHPVGIKIRIVCLLGSVCFGLAISNLIYLAFMFSGLNFEKNYFTMAAENISLQGHLDSEVTAAASPFSIGNLAMWTIGSTLHALFDNSLWSMAVCGCYSERDIIDQLKEYKRIGAMSLSLYVTGIVIVACVTVGVRISIGGYDDQSHARNAITTTFSDHNFLLAYAFEVYCAFFVFYPLVAFFMFAGFLRCLHPRIFGGRRHEMMSRLQETKRQDRLTKRQHFLNSGGDDPRISITTAATETQSWNPTGVRASEYGYDPMGAGVAEYGYGPTGAKSSEYGYDDNALFFDNKSLAGDQYQSHRNLRLEEDGCFDDGVIPTFKRSESKTKEDREQTEVDSITADDVAQIFLNLLMGDEEKNPTDLQSENADSESDISILTEDRSVMRRLKDEDRASRSPSRLHDDSKFRERTTTHGDDLSSSSSVSSSASSSDHTTGDGKHQHGLSSVSSKSSSSPNNIILQSQERKKKITSEKVPEDFSTSDESSRQTKNSVESASSKSFHASDNSQSMQKFSRSRSLGEGESESSRCDYRSGRKKEQERVESLRKETSKLPKCTKSRERNDDDEKNKSDQGDCSISQSESLESSRSRSLGEGEGESSKGDSRAGHAKIEESVETLRKKTSKLPKHKKSRARNAGNEGNESNEGDWSISQSRSYKYSRSQSIGERESESSRASGSGHAKENQSVERSRKKSSKLPKSKKGRTRNDKNERNESDQGDRSVNQSESSALAQNAKIERPIDLEVPIGSGHLPSGKRAALLTQNSGRSFNSGHSLNASGHSLNASGHNTVNRSSLTHRSSGSPGTPSYPRQQMTDMTRIPSARSINTAASYSRSPSMMPHTPGPQQRIPVNPQYIRTPGGYRQIAHRRFSTPSQLHGQRPIQMGRGPRRVSFRSPAFRAQMAEPRRMSMPSAMAANTRPNYGMRRTSAVQQPGMNPRGSRMPHPGGRNWQPIGQSHHGAATQMNLNRTFHRGYPGRGMPHGRNPGERHSMIGGRGPPAGRWHIMTAGRGPPGGRRHSVGMPYRRNPGYAAGSFSSLPGRGGGRYSTARRQSSLM